jgi:hypothetical protein
MEDEVIYLRTKRSASSSSSSAGSGRESAKQPKTDFWSGATKEGEKPTETATCPICSLSLWPDNALNNLHIDKCLAREERSVESSQEKELLALNHGASYTISAVENLPGLYLIEDFVTEKEELELIQQMNDFNTPWKHPDGNCHTKSFGPRR